MNTFASLALIWLKTEGRQTLAKNPDQARSVRIAGQGDMLVFARR